MPALDMMEAPVTEEQEQVNVLLSKGRTDFNTDRERIGEDPIRRTSFPVDWYGGGYGGSGLGDSVSINLFYYHFLRSTIARKYYIDVPEISTPLTALKNRIFKNGLTIESNPLMASETHSKRLNLSPEEREAEYQILADFIDVCNGYDRTLEEELKAFYDSLNIYDCAYFLLHKDYDNVKTTKRSNGTVRIDPSSVRLMAVESIEGRVVDIPLNSEGKTKKKYLFCPKHRENRLIEFSQENVNKLCHEFDESANLNSQERTPMNDRLEARSKEYEEKYSAEDLAACNLPVIPVAYLYRPYLSSLYAGDRATVQSKTSRINGAIPLAASEVIAARKREHTELYGRSIIPRLGYKLDIILGLDYMASNTFTNRPLPSHALLVNTGQENVKLIRQAIEDDVKSKSDSIAILGIQGEGGISNKMELKPIPTTLETIKYTELKQGVIREISAAFGVDTNTVTTVSGGVQGQNFQIQVITDVVESDIRVLNGVLNGVTEAMGIKSWVLRVKSPDSKEETARSAIQSQKIANMTAVSREGFDVEIYGDTRDASNIDFKVSGTNKQAKVNLDTTLAQALVQLAQLQMLTAQMEQGQIPPQAEAIQQNVQGLLSKGGLADVDFGALIANLQKAKENSEKEFGGRTKGITPTAELKTPAQQGKTSTIPKVSTKVKKPKISVDGDVKLSGDMSET